MEQIEILKQWVKESQRIVAFTGAGVSTESGIGDFRSTDGLYHQKFEYAPETIISHSFLMQNPEYFFRFYREHLMPLGYEPNVTHRVLAQWEKERKLLAVVTQNIDGLHQKAGSQRVHELHGSVLKNYCVRCGKKYPAEFVRDSHAVPTCTCGGMVRPDVTLYGEFLPKEAHDRARKMIREADLLIIGGTSLQVGSAAGLARQFDGGRLVVINKSRTLMDGEADLVFHDSIGKVLTAVSESI